MTCIRGPSPLDLCPTGESRVPLAMAPPVAKGADGCDQPEQRASENNPHGILHALDIRVAFRILLDVHLSGCQSLASVTQRNTVRHAIPEGVEEAPTLPKRPNRAIQRMKSITFHTQVTANRIMNGTRKRIAVRAERPPTTSANIYMGARSPG